MPAMVLVGSPLEAREFPLPHVISPEGDEFGFARAMDAQFAGDRLVVLENVNSRLIVFDRDLRPVRYIGREGAGPGELRGAYSIATREDEYAVSEINNARVTIFGADGAYRRSFGVPDGLTELAYAPDGTLYVKADDGEHYLYGVEASGVARPFGQRPWDLYPEAVLTSPRVPGTGLLKFAVTDSGTVHVYDAILGALVTFAPSGERRAVHRLPGRVYEGLVERSRERSRDFGGTGANARPGITDLSVSDDGRLLLLFPPVDHGVFGLLVDASTFQAQRVRWSAEVQNTHPGWGGATGVVRGGLFYRALGDDVLVFSLEPG
jgi:hypothetical protein